MRICIAALFTFFFVTAAQAVEHDYDVVVYGGTAGGASAAIAAAGEGLDVALIEPSRHIGGMVTGGLGASDVGKRYVIGGNAREFFVRLGKHYGEDITWFFEPHAAQKTIDGWLAEAGVDIHLEQRVDRVEKEGPAIRALVTEKGEVFRAPVFIDAGYEGDLMQRAGVSYTWGREGRAQYGESLAGVVAVSQYHQFDVKVSPFREDGSLVPLVYGGEPGAPGDADRKIQAYNFRLCLSNIKENQVPFPKPSNYDPSHYELLRRYLQARPETKIAEMMIISMMPNNKTDINNKGPISTDYIGGSWEYPEADYARRAEIWEEHKQYVLGFLYFMANDDSVPKALQEEVNSWGLAKDEFVNNGHWPAQLYVREARRMLGDFVMTQRDVEEEREKEDSIGMGSYNIDSHHIQRVPTAEGGVINEGDVQVRVPPYEIPYRVLLPKASECTNLLVTSCVSASHVAYGTLRMEPQYMIMGESAGIAAAMVQEEGVSVQEVEVKALQERLRAQGQILGLEDTIADYIDSGKLPGVVFDNLKAETEGEWFASSSVGPFVGNEYLHQAEGGNGSVRFAPALPAAGTYEVRVAYTPHPNRASNVQIVVHTGKEEHLVTLNQRKSLPKEGQPFLSIGEFDFETSGGYVEIQTEGADGFVVADAVQWLPVE